MLLVLPSDWDLFLQLRTLQGGHRSRVGALSWNDHILSTGGQDALIINNDVRIRSHITQIYRGHRQEVCGLKWSGSGKLLASGGNDNLLYIWDRSIASTQSLHRFEDHIAAVRALAWSPFQSNLLASGGGDGDRCIKFWNTHTGVCLNSVDTRSQVSSLLWSKNERELLSSHGFPKNQLTLWKYPSMDKIANLTGHTSRVLFTAQVLPWNLLLLKLIDVYSRLYSFFLTSDCLLFSTKFLRVRTETKSHLLGLMKGSWFGMFLDLQMLLSLQHKQQMQGL